MEGQSPPTASAEGEQGESDDLPAPQPAEPGESAGAAVGAAPLVGGCGLGAGMLFLGCFPLVLFGAVVGSIVGVFFVLQGGTSDEGALLLDQLAVAEERWHAQHGSYFEGPPWPEGAFLLDGGSCSLTVSAPGGESWTGLARCTRGDETVVWSASESSGPVQGEAVESPSVEPSEPGS